MTLKEELKDVVRSMDLANPLVRGVLVGFLHTHFTNLFGSNLSRSEIKSGLDAFASFAHDDALLDAAMNILEKRLDDDPGL